MSPQSVLRSRGNKRTLIIGFDFGTHSTKVVLRERGKPDARVSHFDDFTPGYPTFASPSLIRQKGGQLFFGSEAATTSGGQLFSSLKVALLCKKYESNRTASQPLDSSQLVSAYLAWAFQRVRDSLAGEQYANVLLNLAAPMSHIEDVELKARYLKILQTAWELSFGSHQQPIFQGISVEEASRLIRAFNDREVAGPEQRRFEVLPETIAPVVSLSLDPWMEPGMYMIVDTGAGTTEISVFHAGEPGADQTVLCYRDETMLLGGNDLWLADSKSGKERNDGLKEILTRMTKQYLGMWQKSYLVDAKNHTARRRWKELTLVLSGGGTRHSEVATRLSTSNPMYPWPKDETRLQVCRHVPGTLDVDGRMDDDDLSMFAVANGLAIERRHWPIVFQPNEIEHLDASHVVEEKPDSYWYLNAK